MNNRFVSAALLALVVVLGAIVAQPWLERVVSGAAVPRAVAARGPLSEAERTAIEVFERVSPSVVQVVAQSAQGPAIMEDEGGRGASGTGFVWDDAGHVVTNDHVVQGASVVGIRLASGEVVQADVVGLAPNYDLAVVRMRARRQQLPPALAIGTSADLKVGQGAFAIGNPYGLDQSLTSGIISALKRRLPTQNGREIANVIQTDAAINPGNSGGPLLDSGGRLIGVNTAILSPSGTNAGIGFAIPVDSVNRVVPELIRNGRVPTPGIGIVAASEAAATRIGVEGVVVVRTAPGSPADRAGLAGIDFSSGSLGDVIVEANGKPLHRLSDLTDEIEQIGAGKSITLSVRRDGKTRTVDVEIVDVTRNTSSLRRSGFP